jgi:hypothetical protein
VPGARNGPVKESLALPAKSLEVVAVGGEACGGVVGLLCLTGVEADNLAFRREMSATDPAAALEASGLERVGASILLRTRALHCAHRFWLWWFRGLSGRPSWETRRAYAARW